MPTAFEGFKSGNTIIPVLDAKAQNGVIANTKLIKDTVGWSGKNKFNIFKAHFSAVGLSDEHVNANGSLFMNGTTTGEFLFPDIVTGEMHKDIWDIEPNGEYIFSIGDTGVANLSLQVFVKATSGSAWSRLISETNVKEIRFTLPSSYYDVWIRLDAVGGTTFSNVTLYPMLRDADILDPTFEPYHESVEDYTFPRSEQAVLSARNILDIEAWFKSADISYTKNGNEYAIATVKSTKYQFAESDIDVKVTGTIANGTATNVRVRLYDSNNTQIAESTQNSTFVLKGKGCKIGFYYGDSGSATATEFMITLGTDESINFSPFTMSNEQLTKNKQDKIKSFSSTYTTSGNGNFSVNTQDIPYSATVLSVVITSGATYGAIGIPYKNLDSAVQSVHVMGADGTNLGNTSVDATMYYID